MTTKSQEPGIAFHALASALPAEGDPPEWVTIFPKLGDIVTRDGRRYIVDAATLMARFETDGIDIPIDVNHSTDTAAFTGSRSDAVGWISKLRVEGGALLGKAEWLAEGKSLLAAKSYRFVSPSFFHTPDGKTTWLKALALVTAPALGNQPALAAAQSTETHMLKELAAALGVAAEASEAALLAALRSGFVPKTLHDETLAQLTAANTKLTAIETDARKAKVDALIEGALKDKKILPAEREHYVSLCATDSGLDGVAKLLAARTVQLPASGLDGKTAPDAGSGEQMTPAQLAAKATKMVETGEAASFLDAVAALQAKHFAAA
jgi:phage I-like protein